MSKRILIFSFIILSFSSFLFSQTEENQEKNDESVVYEKLYDEPYDVYKLWIKFQPMYFDIFMSNFNAGFGFEAEYLEYEKFDLRMAFRKPYSSSTDVYRNAGEVNNDFVTNLRSAYFFEIGGSYHVYDDVKDGIAKIVLRRIHKSAKARARENIKPVEFINVAANVREIVGVRAGFMSYSTSINLSDLAVRQNIESFTGNDGTVINDFTNNRLYGSMAALGFYVGGSYAQFRNVIIKPENYSNLANDILFNTYADILVVPSFSFSDVFIMNESFDISAVKTNPIGFRLGLEGKFNQKFTYCYAFETGIRPSVSKRGLFALVKLSFPVLATSLKMKKESFESVGTGE